jgi:hypothetical protein
MAVEPIGFLACRSGRIQGEGIKTPFVEEAWANGRLIAAAPELLAALRKVLPLVESLVLDGEPYFNDQEEARAAIAKAEGTLSAQ